MAELNSITLEQLREVLGYQDGGNGNLMVLSADKTTTTGIFRYPCRLDAVVMVLCTEGKAKAMINLKEYEVEPNVLAVNLPENITQVVWLSDDFRGQIIVVSLEFLRSVHIDLKNAISLYMYIKDHPLCRLDEATMNLLTRFHRLIQDSVEENSAPWAGSMHQEVVNGLVGAYMYRCCELLNNIPLEDTRTVKSRRETLFRQFIELLNQHHNEERSVGFYADKMHITPKYMSSLMKEMTGRTAAEWIDEYVILEAKTLLKYSGLSIQEVAYRLNFSTQSFFGKYFRQHTGMSPGQYKMK